MQIKLVHEFFFYFFNLHIFLVIEVVLWKYIYIFLHISKQVPGKKTGSRQDYVFLLLSRQGSKSKRLSASLWLPRYWA